MSIDKAIIVLIFLFLISAGLILLFILVSRAKKNNNERKQRQLQNKFQSFIMLTLMNEVIMGLDYQLKEITTLLGSKKNRQLMINLIMASHQNLAGKATTDLRKIYSLLKLPNFSQKKLYSSKPQIVIEGLHELAEMHHSEALPKIIDLFNRGKNQVSQEAFIAIIRLTGRTAFRLIKDYDGPVTTYTKLIIAKHLDRWSEHQLPKFKEWYSSSNPHIKIFALEMIAHFRQLNAIDFLGKVLHDPNEKSYLHYIVNAIGNLGASQYATTIEAMAKWPYNDEALNLTIIDTLGKIGNRTNTRALSYHMIHGMPSARIHAIRALIKLKVNPLDYYLDFNTDLDSYFPELYQHATDPLLQ